MLLLSKKGLILVFLGIGLVLNLVGHSVALKCYNNLCHVQLGDTCESPKPEPTLIECPAASKFCFTRQDFKSDSTEFVGYDCGDSVGEEGCSTHKKEVNNTIRSYDECNCKGEGCNTLTSCSCSDGGGSGGGVTEGVGSGVGGTEGPGGSDSAKDSTSTLGFSSVLLVVSTFLTGTNLVTFFYNPACKN